MPSKRFTQRQRDLIRARARQDRRLIRELDNDTRNYRADVASALQEVQRRGEQLRTVVAEGDSWFNYPLGRSITTNVENHKNVALLNLASYGDEGKQMLGLEQRDRLERVLRAGPAKNRKFNVLMFSAGGNDLLGHGALRYWINRFEQGMTPEDTLNTRHLKHIFGIIDIVISELFLLRDATSPETKIYLNAYDFAPANGEGVCGLGPWLQPSLLHRKVPRRLHNQVVRLLLQKYERRLKRHAKSTRNARVIETQGILTTKEWANEIHPKNSGFKKVARRFNEALDKDFPWA